MSNLVQPIAIWNGIPSHSITQMLLDFDNNLLVSGGKNGQIVLWGITKNEDDKVSHFHSPHFLFGSYTLFFNFLREKMIYYAIQPKCLLLGHSTEITCITVGYYDWRNIICSSKN